MTWRVAIIDYGMGNVRSVGNAFAALGASVRVTRDAGELRTADHLVLPGVGAFADGMRNLRTHGLVDVLTELVVGQRKPFIGLCLGMQLLVDTGHEHGDHAGLGWIPGVAQRLAVPSAAGLRVPHIGWNDVRLERESALLKGIQAPQFYFVHSYHVIPLDTAIVTGTCDHGLRFAATLEQDNVFATQFHPEKSHHSGARLLRNFLEHV